MHSLTHPHQHPVPQCSTPMAGLKISRDTCNDPCYITSKQRQGIQENRSEAQLHPFQMFVMQGSSSSSGALTPFKFALHHLIISSISENALCL